MPGLIGFSKRVLPRPIRGKIFAFGFHLDRARFHEFAFKYAYAPSMGWGLRACKARGLECSHILDIGAYQGDWARLARRIWPEATITMIEANREKAPLLRAASREIDADLILSLAGAEDGEEVDFFVMEAGSSVFAEHSPLERGRVRQPTATVDRLMAGRPVDFMKVDVQGYELEVLRGARATMEGCKAILLEVALLQINEGAPLIVDVLNYMSERGFVSYEILEIHRRPLDQAMNQVDILFLPRTSPLLQNTAHY